MKYSWLKKHIIIVVSLLVIAIVGAFSVGYSIWYLDGVGASKNQIVQPKLNDIKENFTSTDKISTHASVKSLQVTKYKLLGGTLHTKDENDESFNYNSPAAPIINRIIFKSDSAYNQYNPKNESSETDEYKNGLYIVQNVFFSTKSSNLNQTTKGLIGYKNTVTSSTSGSTTTYTAGEIDKTLTFTFNLKAKESGYAISCGNNVYDDWQVITDGKSSSLNTDEKTLLSEFGFTSTTNISKFNYSNGNNWSMLNPYTGNEISNGIYDKESSTSSDDEENLSYSKMYNSKNCRLFSIQGVKQGYANVLIYIDNDGGFYIWTTPVNTVDETDGYYNYIKVVDCKDKTSISYTNDIAVDSNGFLDNTNYSSQGCKFQLKSETTSRTVYGVSTYTGSLTSTYYYPTGKKSDGTSKYSIGSNVSTLYYIADSNESSSSTTITESSIDLSKLVTSGYKLIDHQTGETIYKYGDTDGIDFSKSMLFLLVPDSCTFTY